METRIIKWIEQTAFAADKRTVSYRLDHVMPDGDKQVSTAPFDRSLSAQEALVRISDRFRDELSNHFEGYETPQRYRVTALGVQNEELSHRTFEVRPTGYGVKTQAQNVAEASADLMRVQLNASESNLRLSTATLESVVKHMQALLDQAYGRIRELETQRIKEADLREHVLGKAHEREMELQKLTLDEARKDRMLDKATAYLGPMLPDLIRKLRLLPASTTEGDSDRAKLVRFFKTLSDEQQTKLVETLTQEQIGMLIPFMGEDTPEQPPSVVESK